MSLATNARRIFALRKKSVAATGVAAAAASAIKLAQEMGWNAVPFLLYKTEQWLSASAMRKAILIACSFGLLGLAGGLAYRLVSRTPFKESMFKAVQFLSNSPGSSVNEEESDASTTVAFSLFFTGLVVYSVFIGIISTDVRTAFDKVAEGHHRVVEKSHTVVVNWNENTIPVLRQLASAKREGAPVGVPVVVLGNRGKEDMDNLLRVGLTPRDRRTLRVITRSGNPSQPAAMARAAAASARRVLLLRPTLDPLGRTIDVDNVGNGGVGTGLRQIEDTVMAQATALQSARASQIGHGSKKAAQMQTTTVISTLPPADAVEDSAKSAVEFFDQVLPVPGRDRKGSDAHKGKSKFLVVPERSYIPRMIAQTVLHPGVCRAHAELTSFQGVEFSTLNALKDLPSSLSERLKEGNQDSAAGDASSAEGPLTVGELRSRLRGDSLICGVLRRPSSSSSSPSPTLPSAEVDEKSEVVAGGFPDDDATWLFPSDALSLRRDDRLVILTPQKSSVRFDQRKKATSWGEKSSSSTSATTAAAPTPRSDDFKTSATPTPKDASSPPPSAKARSEVTKVLVLNWSPRVGGLLEHLEGLSAAANSNSDASDDEHFEVTVLMSPEAYGHAERFSLEAEQLQVRQMQRQNKGSVKVRVVEGSPWKREDLERAGAASANSVLVLRAVESSDDGSGGWDPRAPRRFRRGAGSMPTWQQKQGWSGPPGSEPSGPDSSTLVALTHLHAAIRDLENPRDQGTTSRRLLVEFSSPDAMEEARAVVWGQKRPAMSSGQTKRVDVPLWDAVDMFVPEDLESGALVQIALDANVATVFDRLLDNEGVDVSLSEIPAPPEIAKTNALQPSGSQASEGAQTSSEHMWKFGELVAAQDQRRHVVIGIRRWKESGGFETMLCPSKNLKCTATDELVVLAFSEGYGGV